MGPTPPKPSADQSVSLPFGVQTHPVGEPAASPLPFTFPNTATSSVTTPPMPSTSAAQTQSESPVAALLNNLLQDPGAIQETLNELGEKVSDSIANNEIVDPVYINGPEDFEGAASYNALAAKVQEMKPANITPLAEACKGIADMGLDADFQDLHNVIGTKWTGTAATAAAGAVTALTGSTTELGTGVTDIGTRLESVSSTASLIRVKIPNRQFGTPLTMLSMGTGAAAKAKAEIEEEDARREAIAALQTIYSPGYTNAGTGVPVLPAPRVLQGGDGSGSGGFGPTGGPGSFGGQGDSSGGGGGAPGTGENAPGGQPGAENPAGTDPAAQQPANGQPGTAGPASTGAAATMNPNASGTQGHLGNSPGRDGLVGPGTGPGSGSGSGASGAAHGGAAGAFGAGGGAGSRRGSDRKRDEGQSGGAVGMMPGVPPGAAALGAGAGAGAGAAVGAASQTSLARPGIGMGGGGGMMAPRGAGAGGDDDKEHKTPSYLVNVDNGNDLIGPIDPVAPPVIGA